MAVSARAKATMRRLGLRGVNKPKRTPGHPKKTHVVMASSGGRTKLIRFGQKGASPAGKKKGPAAAKKRRAFKARHAAGIKKGVMSGSYWSNKVRW